MGFFGILEDHKLPHVPGTVILNEQSAHSEDVTAGLKHGTGRNSHIVLVPVSQNTEVSTKRNIANSMR